MFSFDKYSYESRLLKLLQNSFLKTARRNKILAKWAGGRMGYKDSALNKYVKSMILSYLIAPSDRRIINRILSDFKKAKIKMTEDDIRKKIKAVEERIQSRHSCVD
ncbi:MAG: DUF1476 domain-containing protein [Holosporaceae bacterium]|jgi:hypothetical protein|nr:DUF1476 domain-containing protein [Holosporaceae bacterium]